jgi:hypothetical protein
MYDNTSREEHLKWCKDRALEYVEQDDLRQAFASFQSDMRKHKETCDHIALNLGTMLLMSNNLKTEKQMTEWLNGFN